MTGIKSGMRISLIDESSLQQAILMSEKIDPDMLSIARILIGGLVVTLILEWVLILSH